MNTLKAFVPLFDLHMVSVVTLALVGTFVCRELDLLLDLPAEIVSIAVIFPLVFSIASAYQRREDALKSFASLKANVVALYFAYRDWPDARDGFVGNTSEAVRELMHRIGRYFKASDDTSETALHAVYGGFSTLSRANEKLRTAGVSPTEISRVSQYLRDIMTDFETMRNFAHYRTPLTLRAFSRLFLTVFPVLFTPYFAVIGHPGDEWVGYVVALLYSIVLVSLDNIQEHLEHPYDAVGPDDLHLDIADEYIDMVIKDADSETEPLRTTV